MENFNILQNKKDLKFLRIVETCLYIYVFSGVISIFRTLGYGNFYLYLSLIIERILDLVIIFSYFYLLGNKIRIRNFDWIILFTITYPFLIGIITNFSYRTFFNDSFIYIAFFLKMIAIRSTIERLNLNLNLENIFKNIFKRFLKVGLISSLISVIVINILPPKNIAFYYQLPIELTVPMALSLINNYNNLSILILVIGFISGKRGILISFAFMFISYNKLYHFSII